MSTENNKPKRDPVSNKNDMIIDVMSEIICEDISKLLGEPMPHADQIESRIRLGTLHDLIEFYDDTMNV